MDSLRLDLLPQFLDRIVVGRVGGPFIDRQTVSMLGTELVAVRLNVYRSGGRSEFQFHRSRIKPSILFLVSDQCGQCSQPYGSLW